MDYKADENLKGKQSVKATWAYLINTPRNANMSGEVFLYVLTHFFVLLPTKIESLHNRSLGVV